jgi:hypothetical protein
MTRYGKAGYSAGPRPPTLGVLMNQGGTKANKKNACGNIASLMVQGSTPTSNQVRIGSPPRLNVLMKQ